VCVTHDIYVYLLLKVFKYLEENEFEYTVRISVVELYNEELSDLIASADDGSNAGNIHTCLHTYMCIL